VAHYFADFRELDIGGRGLVSVSIREKGRRGRKGGRERSKGNIKEGETPKTGSESQKMEI
jgi:hypothetical protein